jgi:hypothetical protein
MNLLEVLVAALALALATTALLLSGVPLVVVSLVLGGIGFGTLLNRKS